MNKSAFFSGQRNFENIYQELVDIYGRFMTMQAEKPILLDEGGLK